jgi:hypothetical protein
LPYVAGMDATNTTPALPATLRPPLDRKAAAAYLSVSVATLAKWAGQPGKGPRYSRSSDRRGCVWYRVEDLDEFVERRAVRS